MVQPEFSLERVKVVHNDLADADVEMVPVKSARKRVVTRADIAAGAPSVGIHG